MDDLQEELRMAERSRSRYQEQWDALTVAKREIELWLSQKNVTRDGLRVTVFEHEAMRQKKVKEKFALEARLASLKKDKHFWTQEVVRLTTSISRREREALTLEKDYTLQEKLNIAQGQIDDLRQKLIEWERKYATLDRQFDEVVRQLNAIPKSLR